MIKTNQERQAELRQRRRDAGLKPLTVWLPQEAMNLLAYYPHERRAEVITQALLAYTRGVTVTNGTDSPKDLADRNHREQKAEQRAALKAEIACLETRIQALLDRYPPSHEPKSVAES
jgi:hypothetical protein